MVKVSVEVRSSTARFGVSVQAKTIRRALSVVGARYPQGEVRVIFPAASESFFVEGSAARAEVVEFEHPMELAA
jgi:hypothetical protein